LIEEGQGKAAEELLVECLRIRRAQLPKDDWRTDLAESYLGKCLTQQRRFDEAESYLLHSYPLVVQAPAASIQHKREALENVVALYRDWGKPDQARRYQEELRALVP
jgi:hypothetical protein